MNKAKTRTSTDTISKWETPCLISSPVDEEQQLSEEEIKLKAYEEAHKQGFQAGLEQGEEEIKSRLEVVDSYISALSQPFNDQSHQLAEAIAMLAGKIAKSLVRRELRTEPETIMAIIRDTVTALNTSAQEINIHLNPENARVIRKIINIDSEEQSWNIIDDPLISRSDCKVSSKDSLIDADLQTRIDLIITRFLGDERNENRT